jgi:hypothetical protein
MVGKRTIERLCCELHQLTKPKKPWTMGKMVARITVERAVTPACHQPKA